MKFQNTRQLLLKITRPVLVVFGFALVLFTTDSKFSKISHTNDLNGSSVAHADAPASAAGGSGGADSGDSSPSSGGDSSSECK